MAKKKSGGINPDLEDAISVLLTQVMNNPEASLTDKTKVIDRALKLESIRLKADGDDWGSGFQIDEDDE